MKPIRLLTLLAFGLMACDDSTDVEQLDPIEEPDPDEPAPIDPRPPLDSDPINVDDIRSIDLVETEVTLKLTAIDLDQAEVGVMILERRPLEPQDVDGPALEDTWFPIHATGFFDVSELDDSEIDERAVLIYKYLGDHPAGAKFDCGIKVVLAAAACFDGPAFWLTCPVGLYTMVCNCGEVLGIAKEDLDKLCDP